MTQATIAPAAVQYRIIPNAPAPFALIREPDGTVHARWLIESGALEELNGMSEEESLLSELAGELQAYFDGEAVDFASVPLPRTNSAFVQCCWEACRNIPAGTTISYAELAARAGSPGAARAAGQAMRRNPLPVIIPCHRVVNASGQLHGYAGHTHDRSQSLAIKRRLLEIERAR